jgi:orotidine-5'-phosphate decarboxylase
MNARRFANPVFVALDQPELALVLQLAKEVGPHVGGLKVGLEFLTANGPGGLRRVVEFGLPVFADVKFHDIPNTVAGASREIAALGVSIFNIHASGGEAMMRASIEAARSVDPAVMVIGVTVLTSLDDSDLDSVGQRGPSRDQAKRLALLARRAGLDGVVCAARNLEAIREACGNEFLTVVPGIRPRGSPAGDQKRVMTPAEAVRQSADILVIGRPITSAANPAAAARAVAEELAAELT